LLLPLPFWIGIFRVFVQSSSFVAICTVLAGSACPFDAIKVIWDKEAYEAHPVADPLKCNGCGACEVYCPTGDIKAIRVLQKTA
jgi:formate hydrogenlyase subunit 6/NADH:ubiquinone oxidoreductase subunit I